MRLKITHITRYSFDEPVEFGLQQVRKTPKSTRGQTVLSWETLVDGGQKELSFEDFHRNTVDLVSFYPRTKSLEIRSVGEVEMTDTAGIVGKHEGYAPLWLFRDETARTRPGPKCRELARAVSADADIEKLHALSQAVHDAVRYEVGASEPDWTAEQALVAGSGVCQDHSHVFVTCARLLGFPARYVSGYLKMDDTDTQDATHAWAEAHVDGLGWVGFDVSNCISPDNRYVRVATGLDYLQAAPITGHRNGSGGETMDVSVEVAQQ